MDSREVLSVLKYVSSMKPGFLLSEIQQYLSEQIPVDEIYRMVSPRLTEMHLTARRIKNDYVIERVETAGTLDLTGDEHQRLLSYLGSRQIPQEMQELVEQYITKKVGKPWDDPVILERLRRGIVAQKAEYWKEGKKRGITYRKGYQVLGYLAYHAPVYFREFQYILFQLAEGGLLKERMRILDAGTGPGVVPLAILDFYRNLGRGEAEILSIEKYEENIEAYQYLVPAYAERVPGMQIEKPMQADLMNLPLEETPSCIDLLVFSNVLNEIRISPDQRADVVMHLSENLSPDGTIVIVEPADLVNATEMRRTVSHLLDRGLSMFSPCTFIWGIRCKSPTCWSFEEKGDIKPTRLMEAISAGSSEPYRYTNTDIKFSYALLRTDRRTREVYRAPPQAKFARLSRLSNHVKRRINVVAAVMSADLGDSQNHVYKVCDGTSKESVYAILPRHHESEKNIALRESAYGGVIEIFNVLVRYNREHDAYNLLVDKYTRICPALPQRQPDST